LKATAAAAATVSASDRARCVVVAVLTVVSTARALQRRRGVGCSTL
jgi:hypothetical protein